MVLLAGGTTGKFRVMGKFGGIIDPRNFPEA
jgi:hypothetical protein